MSAMELECVKFKEKMSPDTARCRHPHDFCKYRTSCIIHFISTGKDNEGWAAGSVPEKQETGQEKKADHD